MNKDEQYAFVRELIASVEAEILQDSEHFSEDWDTIELRRLIADRFGRAAFSWPEQSRKRKADFKTYCLVNHL